MSKYCVIGKTLPHTLSPEIHRELGRDRYDIKELFDDCALADFVNRREYDGYNVTIPYKQAIMPLLDGMSKAAKEVGSVNTVVCEDGKLIGRNTDADGMKYALKKAGISLKDKSVLILGSGGTCQTAKYICRTAHAQSVKVVSRTGEINYENCYEHQDVQIIINTTPVGMMPHSYEKPVELSRFENLEGVFDCIYNPLETLLIKDARALGLKAANGLTMLVEQARISHNFFEKAKGLPQADSAVTDEIVEKLLSKRRNLVLIGMAGSGKSVIGRIAAKILNRQFVDTDAEIERLAGKSIPQIFKDSGEEYFRELERAVVENVCIRQGIVISTGGGAVLDERNVFMMKANGVCYMIQRDADKLATKDRPLSPDAESAAKLYEERKPVYLAAADVVVDNDGEIDGAIEQIIADFSEKRKSL